MLSINYELPEYKKSFDRFVSETFKENTFTNDQLIKLVQNLRLYGIKVTCIIVEKLYSAKLKVFQYRLMVYYIAIEVYEGATHKESVITHMPHLFEVLKNKKYTPIKLYDFNRKIHVNGSIKTLNEYVLEYFNTDLTDFILVDTYLNMYEHNFNIIKELEKWNNETNRKKNEEMKKSPEYIALQKKQFEDRRMVRLLKFVEGHIYHIKVIREKNEVQR